MARSAIVVAAFLSAVLLACGADAETASPERAEATARPAGTIVFVSGSDRLTAIDVASGSRTTRRIRAVAACGAELFVTAGHIVFSGVVRGVTTVFSVPIALDRAPTRLGAAHALVPSATEGRVWLAGTDCDRPTMAGVREVTVDGQVTFESDRSVPGSYVTGAVPTGLVVHRRREMFVWDPVTGSARRTGLEWAFDVRLRVVAGCAAGSGCADLMIVDTASARTVRVRRQLDMGAAVSPDGTLLAAPARAGRRWSVAVVDARTGRPTIVPGTRTGRAYPELRWAASSGWLLIRAGRRVMAYRPGASRAVTLPIRLPRSAYAFAAG